MSDDSRAGRMAVRFSDDDKAWLLEHAEDEGVEPATLVRMIINRLRRGRPPLMSMVMVPSVGTAPEAGRYGTMPGLAAVLAETANPQDGNVADEVLQARLAELDNGGVVQLHAEEETAAVPLRRVARTQYNPGRN